MSITKWNENKRTRIDQEINTSVSTVGKPIRTNDTTTNNSRIGTYVERSSKSMPPRMEILTHLRFSHFREEKVFMSFLFHFLPFPLSITTKWLFSTRWYFLFVVRLSPFSFFGNSLSNTHLRSIYSTMDHCRMEELQYLSWSNQRKWRNRHPNLIQTKAKNRHYC